MELDFNNFSIVLLLSGLVTAGISIIILNKLSGAVKLFGVIMLLVTVWAIGYGLELASGNLRFIRSMVIIQYIGVSFLPAVWLTFIFKFIGKESWLTVPKILAVFALPAITFLLVLTNDYHHLHYKSTSLDTSGPFPLLNIQTGIWYKIHTAYFYAALVTGIYLLIKQFKRAEPVFRRQNRIIILGVALPWLINIIYLLDFRPFRHIDLTPFAFILTSLFIGVGLLRFRLFDIVPVARGRVIENMREAVLVLDSKDRVVDANTGMRKILSEDSEDFIGSYLTDFFDSQSQLVFSVKHHLNKEIEVEIGEQTYEVNVTTLFEKTTIYSGTILLFRNITERKLAQKLLQQQSDELQALNELKDKLFSVISHDLRGPLVNLVEMLNFAEDGLVTPEEFKSFLPALKQNVTYTAQLLENLLSWSKSQLRGEDINPTVFDIGNPEHNRIEQYTEGARQKGINLLNDLVPGTMVYADEKMVQLVIRNLVNNAKKFCGDGDMIRIFADTDADTVTVHVLDTGPGIEDKDREKLFNIGGFTTPGTRNEIGTGLGLMICKEFIERNHGTIGVNSFVGQGSDFYFSLPSQKS